jgi:4'-phosphopantetheinyl transferase
VRLTYILVTMPASSLTDPAIAETAPDAWKPGPLRPRLGDGAVHVWRADLAAVSDDLIEVLSLDERTRAERFLKARDGRLWARSHGVLRVLLGRYLEEDAGMLRLDANVHGKPKLHKHAPASAARNGSRARSSTLHFNLAHSGGLALYAFTRIGPVGVDVEVARRLINEVAIATRAFGEAEGHRLKRLDPETRKLAFLRDWTRYEAELKCRGTGISRATPASHEHRPWIAQLHVGRQAAAAVATIRRPREVRRLVLSI